MQQTVHEVRNRSKVGESFVLLDCRTDEERLWCRIDPSLHIPMAQVPQRYVELPSEKPIVVYCHHGVRSLRVTQFLLDQGFNDVVSMAGGIDAWSVQIDPSVPRYH